MIRCEYLYGSWQEKDLNGECAGPVIFEPKRKTRRDSGLVCRQEHWKVIEDAWVTHSKESPAIHCYAKDPDCNEKHKLEPAAVGWGGINRVVCPTDCSKRRVRFAQKTITGVFQAIKADPLIPKNIRDEITHTMVGDHRPYWIKDRKLDDSKCPKHEAMGMALEDYRSTQSLNIHARCGTDAGCQCSETCRSGKCKDWKHHPMHNYNNLANIVLCPKVIIPMAGDSLDNCVDFKRACVEGTCERCGIRDEEGKYHPGLWIMGCELECSQTLLMKHREFEVLHYKESEHPSRQTLFGGQVIC